MTTDGNTEQIIRKVGKTSKNIFKKGQKVRIKHIDLSMGDNYWTNFFNGDLGIIHQIGVRYVIDVKTLNLEKFKQWYKNISGPDGDSFCHAEQNEIEPLHQTLKEFLS